MVGPLHVFDGDASLGVGDECQVLGERFPVTLPEGIVGHLRVCQRAADQGVVVFFTIQGQVDQEKNGRICEAAEQKVSAWPGCPWARLCVRQGLTRLAGNLYVDQGGFEITEIYLIGWD